MTQYTMQKDGTMVGPDGKVWRTDTQSPAERFLGSLFEYGTAKDLQPQYDRMAQEVRGAADPFGQYRPRFGKSIADLYANPGSFSSMSPAYQYSMQQGEEAINRANAASGNFFSGNRALALMEHAQGLASQEYDKELERLGTFAGVGFNPANAAQLYGNARASGMQQQAQASGALGAGISAGADFFRGIGDGSVWGGVKQAGTWLGDKFGGGQADPIDYSVFEKDYTTPAYTGPATEFEPLVESGVTNPHYNNWL